ncbi:MAG: RIP metalloprotease RseP [bacterium]
MSIIIFLAILLVLVVSHEFGHFIVAKAFGIRVDEFAFGFPPKIFGKKFGETEYNLNLLPLGGYVKIFGESPDAESIAGPDSHRSFVNKPLYVQALVLLAGVTMNFLVAWALISFGFISGLPTSVSEAPKGAVITSQYLTVVSVLPASPALTAGLKVGDKILKLDTKSDSTETPSTDSVRYFVRRHGGESIHVTYLRGPEKGETKVIPTTTSSDGIPSIGITMDIIGTLKLPFYKAIWEGFKLSWDLVVATASGFYTLIHDALIGHGNIAIITGPVGIVGVVGDAAKFGFIYILSFTALISINLAVINLVPFPALDGGRLFFLLVEKIKGSRIKPEIANMVNMIGFGILMLLMVIITYHDIVKLL